MPSIFLLIGGVALLLLAMTLVCIAILGPYRASQPGVDRPFGVDRGRRDATYLAGPDGS